ncbi:MAG: aminoacyl-tRNA hydrolase, partial [Planctomycetaceae bacterium]
MRAEILEVNSKILIPVDEFRFTFTRSGGPGGQNVNKVSTRAVLSWPVVESASLPEGVRSRFLKRFANRISVAGIL